MTRLRDPVEEPRRAPVPGGGGRRREGSPDTGVWGHPAGSMAGRNLRGKGPEPPEAIRMAWAQPAVLRGRDAGER